MSHKSQSGFGMVRIVLLIGVLAVAYFMKDEHGVNYLQRGYEAGRYYTIDRNLNAIKAAEDVKATAQLQQDKLQAELNAQ